MRRTTLNACVAGLGLLLVPGPGASAMPYVDNPLVQWLPQQRFEIKLEMQSNFDSAEDAPAAWLAGFGYGVTDSLSVGLYGSVRESDRMLPKRMKRMYGLGGYVEQRLGEVGFLVPYLGGRVGLLDSTGPGYSTALHLSAQAGVLWPLTDRLGLTLSGTVQWASEEFFNYSSASNAKGYTADDMDITLDLGLRLMF